MGPIYKGFTIMILCVLFNSITSHPKGDELRQMTLDADYGLIEFNRNTFQKYVMTHPRPYDVVILFAYRNRNLCERVKNEFIQVSESFRDENGFKPDMANHLRAVFFGILYYSEDKKHIFAKLNPSGATILYTTPQNIQLDDKGETFIKYDEEYIMPFKESSTNIYAQKIIEFTNAKSQRKFPLKKDPIEFLSYFILFVLLLFIGFSIYKNFKEVLLSPKLWLVGSIAVFVICIGGIVYNILHGTSFAKFDRNGNIVEFIHSGQRSQYIGEGILLSTLFVVEGTIFYSFNWINWIPKFWTHKIVSLVLIISSLFIMEMIITIYKMKAPWYNPPFFPPDSYVKGSLINDQGNSF